MNFKRKEAAIKKYGTTPLPELEPALLADSANYEPEEVKEIVKAITEQQEEQTPPEEKNSKEGAPGKPEEGKVAKTGYVEWDVRITKGEAEKLKVSRACVKITDQEAETLNAGVLNGGNSYAKMYFKPE